MKKSNFNLKYLIFFGFFWLIGICHGQDFRKSPLETLYAHYERSILKKNLAGVETLLILNDSIVWHRAQGLRMFRPILLFSSIASITSSP